MAMPVGEPVHRILGERVVVVHNPAAGQAIRREERFLEAIGILGEAGWKVEVAMTSREGHAADLAREAAESGADAVIAAGGDGTVNEVVQGLAHTSACMGCLPMGTVNVWSREVGYSADMAEAARQLITGTCVDVDLGRAGDRYFLLMAGVGLDAEVALAVGDGNGRKQRLGVLPYAIQAARVMPGYRGARVRMEIDGQLHDREVLMVLISNTRLYGGLARPSKEAVANDGWLDIRVFEGNGPLDTMKHVVPFIMGRGSRDSPTPIRAKRIQIQADPVMAVQVDGDPIGSTPIEVTVHPDALRVIVPLTYDRTLIPPSE